MLGAFDQTVILFAIASVIILILGGWISYLHYRFNRLVRTAHKDNIEKSLVEIYDYLKKNYEQNQSIVATLKILDRKANTSPRGLGLVLFKAFDGVKSGGSNSFALALINEQGKGVMISTLHSRDRVNVYSKAIAGFKSDVLLTDEEQEALTKAQKSLSL